MLLGQASASTQICTLSSLVLHGTLLGGPALEPRVGYPSASAMATSSSYSCIQ
jgi:hypothetical protein